MSTPRGTLAHVSRRSFCLAAFAVAGVAACSLIVDTEGLVEPTPTPTPLAGVVETPGGGYVP